MDALILIKLLTALAYPLGLLLVLAMLAWLLQWRGRFRLAGLCRISFALVLILSSNPMVANYLVGALERQYPPQPLANIAKHDAIIVLGGGLRIPLPPARYAQLGAGSDRYWYAAKLYKAGKASHLFIAGGNVYAQVDARGKPLPGEAFYARRLLVEWGVPESAISIDSLSRTTGQNKENVAALLAQRNIESALLVTSAIHMPRAAKLFDELPLKLTPAVADVLATRSTRPAVFNWLPSAAAMQRTTQALHEYYGLAVFNVQASLAAD